MAKNYYDILGISSPAMRKHFMDADKTMEDVKDVVSNMSAAILVTEESLQEMTTAKLLELADTKPIMLIDDSYNNCINLMWLSTIKRGYMIYGDEYINLHFENDYMDADIKKNVVTGDVTQYYPHVKSSDIATFSNNELPADIQLTGDSVTSNDLANLRNNINTLVMIIAENSKRYFCKSLTANGNVYFTSINHTTQDLITLCFNSDCTFEIDFKSLV